MAAGALRKDQDQEDDHDREHGRGEGAAPFEAALVDRLVEKVADGRAERASEDESGPEQEDPADLATSEIEDREDQEPCAEYERAAAIAEAPSSFAGCVSRPVAERGAERLRESDGD